MARRRISLWVEEEMYDDYKRFAALLKETPSDVMRGSLVAGLPSPDELERDYQLPRDLLRSTAGRSAAAKANRLQRLAAWALRRR